MSLKTEEKNTEAKIQKIDKNEKYEGIIEYDTPAYKKRKRRLGDRYDGRLLRSIPAMSKLMPYLMKVRADSQNHFEAEIDLHTAEL